MSRLGKYLKTPSEHKRYQIDYTDWLDTGEAVQGVVFAITNNTTGNPLVIDGIQVLPSQLGVQYYIGGGDDGATYEITATLTTTTGPQVREDAIIVSVREP
jgi:hypothetical protein